MKYAIALITLLFVQSFAFAQLEWHDLQNQGLFLQTRFEDVYFTNASTGFLVGFSGQIYKTTDGGTNWQNTAPVAASQIRSVEFLDDGVTGIAGTLSGQLYRTTNAYTWTDVSSTIPDTGIDKRSICGIAHFNDNYYAVGWWASNKAKFYKSTDKGLTWTTTVFDTSLVSNLADVLFLSADTGFVAGGKNTTGQQYSSNRSVVLKTTDGGATWVKVFSDSISGGRIWKLQALTHKVLFAAIEPYFNDTVAMIKTIDGGDSWNIIGSGFSYPGGTFNPNNPHGLTQSVGFVTEQKGWLGGWYNGFYETTNGGQNWTWINLGENVNRIFVIDSNLAYAAGLRVYKYVRDTATPTNGTHTVMLPHDLYPISPNPSTGYVKIEFDLKTETHVLLEVANTDSRSVTRLEGKKLKKGHYIYYWDGRDKPNGNYIVWLGTDEIPIVQKFTILH